MTNLSIDSQPEIEAKIKSLEELLPIVEQHRENGQTIVTTNGTYDLLHIGHVLSLFESKRQGDVLIVGVNSDRSVKSYKSPERPMNKEEWRIRTLAALSCVDYALLFQEEVPMSWIRRIKPHIHTNSAEYGKDCIEREAVEENGGRIHLIPVVDGVSTTALIRKVLRIYGQDEE